MKRNLVKISAILLLIVAILSIFAVPTFAATPGATAGTGTAGFDQQFEVKDDANVGNTISKVIGTIIFVCQLVGMGVAIIMLLVIAIKYIAASPNDKAEIKKHLVVYIVGAVLLFAASGILQLIKTYALGLGKDASGGNQLLK